MQCSFFRRLVYTALFCVQINYPCSLFVEIKGNVICLFFVSINNGVYIYTHTYTHASIHSFAMSLEAVDGDGILNKWFPYGDEDKFRAYKLRYISFASLLSSIVLVCTLVYMNGYFTDKVCCLENDVCHYNTNGGYGLCATECALTPQFTGACFTANSMEQNAIIAGGVFAGIIVLMTSVIGMFLQFGYDKQFRKSWLLPMGVLYLATTVAFFAIGIIVLMMSDKEHTQSTPMRKARFVGAFGILSAVVYGLGVYVCYSLYDYKGTSLPHVYERVSVQPVSVSVSRPVKVRA